MVKVKTLKNQSGEAIYPLTSTKAVIDENGNTLDTLLSEGASGPSTQRPSNANRGQMYFDTTYGKPIWWNGSTWVDALGLPAVNEYAEVRHVVNGTEVKVISTDAESQGLTIYAPTEVGNDGYIVAQQGNTAAFVDPADIGLK